MNTKAYTNLLSNPNQITGTHQNDLEAIIKKYPYFQSARALQLKALKNQESYLYNDALKLTAAYTTDRNILFDYITSDYFAQDEISQLIQQHHEDIKKITVESENVSEKISLEIDQQIKKEIKKAEAILNPNLFQKKQEFIEEIPTVDEVLPPIEKETENISINQPLEFNKKDSYSFSEWLQLTSATPIKREDNKKNHEKNDLLEEKKQKFKLIEKFIEEKPSLVSLTKKPVFTQNINLAKPYTQAPEAIMTETLAKVYLQQKNYKKAITAYKILILKYPEKSGYFADQIRAIKKLTNT
ncbi:MAG: hypothetical protein ACWA45_00085 [Flavobacteriales bacterium]